MKVDRVLMLPVCTAWLVVAVLSVNHLFRLSAALVLPVQVLGLLAWGALLGTLALLSGSFRRRTLLVFVLFFCFGFWRGPFLEPPSDPFEHLRRIQNFSHGVSTVVPRMNRGLWHYGMAGNIIGLSAATRDPDRILMLLDVTHGLFLGLLMAGLFVLARRAGLRSRWAFMSCLIAFLFMGTGNFSYFSYYSLAPSYTSMLILWLWTAAFFFREDESALAPGLFWSLISLPVLWVNHCQEAVFMGILTAVWLGLFCWSRARRSLSATGSGGRSGKRFLFGAAAVLFVLVLFAAPQFDAVREWLSSFFVRNRWLENRHLVFTWNDLYLWGEFWGHRINDTLGHIGVVMAAFLVPYFRPGFIRGRLEKKIRIAVLAILPFLVYCAPLLNFIWASNVLYTQYYRLCYISMFWLLFTAVLQGLEGRVLIGWTRLMRRRSGNAG